MYIENNRLRLMIGVFVIIFMTFLASGLYLHLQRLDKIKITVETSPENSQLKIDGVSTSAGEIYIKPGRHTFFAEKKGFSSTEQAVVVDKDRDYVALVLQPASNEAIRWSNEKNNNVRTERIAGNAARNKGEWYSKRYPLIKKLPYTSVDGIFSINYGFANNDPNGHIFFSVTNSTASGRKNAINWIREQGLDPTVMDLQFDDFTSPLIDSEADI